MENIFYTLLSIIILFFVILLVKEFFNKKLKDKFCVICTAISLTWIFLLILYWLKLFSNITIIALLMGQTILGIFYVLESKTKDKLKLFRLPFLATLIGLAYFILTQKIDSKTILLLITLWGIFIIIYSYQNNPKLKVFVKKIIECCKKW